MTVLRLSSLTSRYTLYLAQTRGGASSINYILSPWSSFRIPSISIHSLFRQRHSFSSSAVACGASSNRLAREDLVVLGIGTSCDDTAAAVADLLSRYGGVAPKMAEEAHSLVIDKVVQQALDNSNLSGKDLSAVAVSIGPGLSLCLRGSHLRLIERDLQFPFLALLVSGGHNLLILARDVGHYIQLGTTIDNGEAYDKTARWLGLDMSKGGGPALEELANEGDSSSIKFKIPMRKYKDCNFSYAGLKTQVRLAIESRNVCNGCLDWNRALYSW